MNDLKESIRDKALAEGFDTVGFTSADAAPKDREVLARFVKSGWHGDMDWLARDDGRRGNLKAMMPKARTAIVLAANYGPDSDPMAALKRTDRGTISVYAQAAKDYHDVIKKRLKRVGRWLAETHGGDLKVFVDTAPVMEKPLAARAGVGWQGKHSNLVSREFGSWLFLGETAFAARIREWLKTLRKKRVCVVFATQSLDDVAASPIAASLIESCPTQVFLPNPRALEPASAELYRGFGLNRRQLELIAFATPKRAYYWRQPRGRRLFDLRLTGVALALCGSSAPEDQTLIDDILERSGSDDRRPGGFVREFLKAKGVQNVDSVLDAFAGPLAAE